MAWIPEGSFAIGSDDFYPEERPVRDVEVEGFWIDRSPVTVRDFRRFVKETGYVTFAERPPNGEQYPDADPSLLVPGSLVFRATRGPVNLDDYRNWWTYVPGACWHRPGGPGTDTYTRARHPVTHVAWEDAAAYAAWAGKALPNEAEWERAARGGLQGATYAWGDEPFPGGKPLANTWQGEFPWQNTAEDGYAGTSPVGSFPPNGFGLYHVCGNVWEWTADWFTCDHHEPVPSPCCAPGAADGGIPRRVIQGRLALVRAELLPALPARGSTGRDDRHVGEPHWLSLCAALSGLSAPEGEIGLLHKRSGHGEGAPALAVSLDPGCDEPALLACGRTARGLRQWFPDLGLMRSRGRRRWRPGDHACW